MRFSLHKQKMFKMLFILIHSVIVSNPVYAANKGLLFNVIGSGTPTHLSITLCLNGKGPLSCQNYTISALNLNISPTIPNRIYSSIGIKINTPGFTLTGCTPISNGYCLFEASTVSPANIVISSSSASAILSASVSELALSVNNPGLNSALMGTPRQISITNTGTITATNLAVIPTGFPSGTSITTTTCNANLPPAASCSITITPGSNSTSNCSSGTSPMNGDVTVTADNAVAKQIDVLVLSYGCLYQGGYIYSINDQTTNIGSIGGRVTAQSNQSPMNGIIWSPPSSIVSDIGVSIWGIDDASTTSVPSPNASSPDPATLYSGQMNCNGATDGVCNSNNILIYYNLPPTTPTSTYAAGLCTAPINGYSDWYLPSICELGPDTSSICPVSPAEQNIVDNLAILLDNCTGSQCLAGEFWSATELEGNPSDLAWSECFATSTTSDQCPKNKDELLEVRCSRELDY